MTAPVTFQGLARASAAAGAAGECLAMAAELARRAEAAPAGRARELLRSARGMRAAARVLGGRDASASPPRPFGARGLRGALAAGLASLVDGRPGLAELIGDALAAAAPRHPAGPRLVAQALFARGRYALAARALRGALARDPEDGLSRALLAEALWFAGEREGARAALGALRGEGPGAALGAALAEAIRCGALPERLPPARRREP